MSTAVLEQVIQRAIDDQAFREQVKSNPTAALGGYDLSQEERTAVTSGDEAKLTALGIEPRLSKVYKVGA